MSDVLILKKRRQTIKGLGSVMGAMLVITAAKTQKAKIRFSHAVKYSDSIKDIAVEVCSVPNEEKKSADNLMVVIGTNKGLCGNFNDRVFNAVVGYKNNNKGSFGIFALGRNSKRLGKKGFAIIGENIGVVQSPKAESVLAIAKEILKWHKEAKGNVFVAYNEYKSIMLQKPVIRQILPLYGVASEGHLVEPGREEISEPLLLHYVLSMLYRCLVESELGELNSRMLVVKGATDNSKKLLDELSVKINKARQAVITSELSEIVSSFEALKGGDE